MRIIPVVGLPISMHISTSLLGHVWMLIYPPQSMCVGVVGGKFKLNSTSNHPNTHGLRWIHGHPNKASNEQAWVRNPLPIRNWWGMDILTSKRVWVM